MVTGHSHVTSSALRQKGKQKSEKAHELEQIEKTTRKGRS